MRHVHKWSISFAPLGEWRIPSVRQRFEMFDSIVLNTDSSWTLPRNNLHGPSLLLTASYASSSSYPIPLSTSDFMSIVQQTDDALWYVMRVYKNEKKAEEKLSGEGGLPYFIPKQQTIRSLHGRKTVFWVPLIPSMVFVHATHQQIVKFKKEVFNELQFVTWKRADEMVYLTVPSVQMDSFIRMCEQKQQSVCFFKPSEIQLERGTKVRIYGGPFDRVEGTFVKVAGRRRKQVVVILLDMLAVSAEIEPEYIEVIG